MDLYNKVDWGIFSLPRYLTGVGPLGYSILSGYRPTMYKMDFICWALFLVQSNYLWKQHKHNISTKFKFSTFMSQVYYTFARPWFPRYLCDTLYWSFFLYLPSLLVILFTFLITVISATLVDILTHKNLVNFTMFITYYFLFPQRHWPDVLLIIITDDMMFCPWSNKRLY